MMMCEVIYMRVYQPATKLHSLCQATGKKNIEYYYLCKFRVSIHPSFRPSTQVYFSTLPPSIISKFLPKHSLKTFSMSRVFIYLFVI